VGLCLSRSLDLVVTMLAVLKADAVYVPMDPAHPADRLAYTADDAGLRLVVTDVGAFPATSARTVRPGEVAAAGAGGTLAPPCRGPAEAAYVIYTSGSTGRPKGVVVPHRNVVALIAATQEDFGLGPDDTWTLFHSSAFDFSVWEIWGPLLTGGRLVVVPYWVSRSPGEFRDLLVQERVSVLNQTPSAFAQLIEADRNHSTPLSLRLVVFGGEPLDTRVLRTWFDRYPESACRLVNMFGITETTVHVTAQTVTRREVLAGSRSVGPALPGWYLYVLDERGRPVPFGAPGEIHVGGAGVALEYLNRPALTAERFLSDPFRGGRIYRSGDRGRLRPDGRLEHLGRLDSQVKIRGFRIELDEIRNVLLDDPAVTAAAVLVAGEGAQDAAAARIDAYVVLDGDDTAAVRGRAATLLPEYMLPATVTALPALPLTANGKLDTRRLPAPAAPRRTPGPAAADQDLPAAHRRSREPSADLSSQLAEVWEAVLGVPVGPDDNFFSLGGNSLYAVRVAAAMSERRLPSLPMRELYLHPTVRRLAAALAPAGEA
jgi:amino acid adenylation domain-containing protein